MGQNPTEEMVPIIAPDGSTGEVPRSRASQAIADGGKLGVWMMAPNGESGVIPRERLDEAVKAGGRQFASFDAIQKFRAMRSQSPQIKSEPMVMDPVPWGPLMQGVTQTQARSLTSVIPWLTGGAGALLGEGLGSIPGAAIGGAGGEALRQLVNRGMGLKDQATDTDPMEAASRIGTAGLTQGAIEGVTHGLGAAGRVIAPALKESAATSLRSAMMAGGGTKNAKIALDKVMPRLLQESPTAWSRKGLLAQFTARVQDALGDMTAAEQAVNPQLQVAKKNIIADLDERINQMTVKRDPTITPEYQDWLNKAQMLQQVKGNPNALPLDIRQAQDAVDLAQKKVMGLEKLTPDAAAGAVDTLKAIQQTVKDADPSFSSVLQLRRSLDASLKSKNGLTYLANGKILSDRETTRYAADAIRKELSATEPNVAAAFKEYSFWRNVKDIMSETVSRKQGQEGNLTRRILTGAGAVAGAPAGLAGEAAMATTVNLATRAVDSTAWRTVSSAAKKNLAQLIASGNFRRANAALIRIVGAGNAAASEADSAQANEEFK